MVEHRIFLPVATFSADSLSVSVHPPCAIAYICIYAHVKDPVVHVRVLWIMETLKHPAYTVGWVARLCRSWLSSGRATRISHGRNPMVTIQYSCFIFLSDNLVLLTLQLRVCISHEMSCGVQSDQSVISPRVAASSEKTANRFVWTRTRIPGQFRAQYCLTAFEPS